MKRKCIKKGIIKGGILAVGIIGMLGTTACGEKEQTEPIEITLIHGWGGTMSTHKLMQEIYEDFDKQNEDIILNFQPSSDSSVAVDKANNLLAVDKMPNIVSTNGQSLYVQNAIKKGMALDLMPYIEADEELRNSIHPAVFDLWSTSDGGLYTIPDALEVMGYWYNEAYFREAGIVDEQGNVKIPTNWDEFYQACEKLDAWKENNKRVKGVFALESVQVVDDLFLARLAGESEEGLEMAQAMPATFEVPVFRKVIDEIGSLWKFSYNTDSLNNARQYFKEGGTAIYFNGVWESESLLESRSVDDIKYATYPTNMDGGLSYISPSSGYVVYDSPDQRKVEASIRFIKYMLSEEVQTKLAQITGQAPLNPNVNDKVENERNTLIGNALSIAHDATYQINTISSTWNGTITEILSNGLYEATQDEEKKEELIDKLNMAY